MGVITAHSGCDGTEDNSLEFIAYALASEADCLEVDVRQDQCGDLYLAHNENEARGVLVREAFALLKERTEKKLNCDLKRKGLEIPIYRLAEEWGVERQIIYSGEVSVKLLEEKEREFPDAEIYLNIENICPGIYEETDEGRRVETVKNALTAAADCPIACINMEYHLYTGAIRALFEKMGVRCSVWTVNEEKDIRAMLESGAANITTRNLKRALEIRAELMGRSGIL